MHLKQMLKKFRNQLCMKVNKINTIYVSIISCREQYLEQTVRSAISNAKNPDRIRIGIFNTDIGKETVNISDEVVKIDIINCLSDKALGVGASRMNGILMCPADIDFILQIDAHMIFEKDWDETLENEFLKIEDKEGKSIITAQVITWNPGKNNEVLLAGHTLVDPYNVKKGIFDPYAAPILAYKNIDETIGQGYPQTWGRSRQLDENYDYVESYSISGNFVFARSSFFKEIMHDPRCYWGADEGVFAMRAWTRGYRIFSLNKNILYHLHKWLNQPAIKMDWRDAIDDAFTFRLDNTYKTIKNIYTGKELGYWGAPNQELLDRYSEISGFNFKEYYDKIEEIKLKGE